MVFDLFILILIAGLFESSKCLDDYRPPYGQNVPLTGYIQPNQYQYPHQSGMYYQGAALDEAYHHNLDYHRSQSQQNYGQIARRSLPSFTVRQVPCPHTQAQQSPHRCYRSIPMSNYQYPYCDAHDYPKVIHNNGDELIPQQERDSRSVTMPSTLQSDGLNLPSPVYIPNYSTNPSMNKTISKRSYSSPIITYTPPNRRNNSNQIIPAATNIPIPIETAPNFPQTSIISPSRKFVTPNNTSSDRSQGRSNFPRDHNVLINYPRNQFNNYMRSSFDKFNNDKIFMDNSRSSGSTGAETQYLNNFPTHQFRTEHQKPLRNFPTTSDFRFANAKQSVDSLIQRPIPNYGPPDVFDNPHKRYGRMNNFPSADYFPLSSLSLSNNNNNNAQVNHKPNVVQNIGGK